MSSPLVTVQLRQSLVGHDPPAAEATGEEVEAPEEADVEEHHIGSNGSPLRDAAVAALADATKLSHPAAGGEAHAKRGFFHDRDLFEATDREEVEAAAEHGLVAEQETGAAEEHEGFKEGGGVPCLEVVVQGGAPAGAGGAAHDGDEAGEGDAFVGEGAAHEGDGIGGEGGVGVQKTDDVAGGVFDGEVLLAGAAAGGFEHAGSRGAGEGDGGVGAAAVDDDHFIRGGGEAAQVVQRGFDGARFVEGRDDDRDRGHGLGLIAGPGAKQWAWVMVHCVKRVDGNRHDPLDSRGTVIPVVKPSGGVPC